MSLKLVRTASGFAVYGGDFAGPEKVSKAGVKALDLDEGIPFWGSKKISELEYRALSKKYF